MKNDWGDNLDVRYYLAKKLKSINNRSVLDVGCGNGYLATLINDTNNYLGIDNDSDSILKAIKLNPTKTFKTETIEDVYQKFDVIVLANIIECIKDKKRFIEKAYSLLNDNGVIFITTPNGDNKYFNKKGKVKEKEMIDLLNGYSAKICKWNPLPIQTHHILKYIRPLILPIYEFLMDKINHSVWFYVEIYK